VPRTIGITTSTTPILQRSGINIPKLNSAYYSQVKGNEAPKIALRPSKYLLIINKLSWQLNKLITNFRVKRTKSWYQFHISNKFNKPY
jgi:hypothetical protein